RRPRARGAASRARARARAPRRRRTRSREGCPSRAAARAEPRRRPCARRILRRVRVLVRLFASYREAAGVGHIEVELPDGATVRDAIREVLREHPLVAEGRQLVIARNEEYVDPAAPLADGDEVAL